METKEIKQQWEEKENIKQKKKENEPKINNKWIIIGGIEIESTKKTKNGIIKIKEKKDRKILNIKGHKYNRLTVLEFTCVDKNNNTLWKCLCNPELGGCGNIKNISIAHLRDGKTKSCGCLGKEILKNNKFSRKEKGENGFNNLFNNYKKNAEKKNLEFVLTKDQFKNLTSQNCFYCGEEPKSISQTYNLKEMTAEGVEWSKYIYNGIDRKDNNEGYLIENCVPCCFICNRKKSNMDIDEFDNWIKRIYNHRFNTKKIND